MQSQDPDHPSGVSSNDKGGTSLATARRRKAQAALRLKLSGASWEDVCATEGFSTPRRAQLAIEKALQWQLEHDPESKELMRNMAGRRLDRLLMSVWRKAIMETHNPDGSISTHPEQMVAVGKAREIIADHRKLFGLDAPTEYVINNPTANQLEEWVNKALAIKVPKMEELDIFDLPDDDVTEVPEVEAS